MPKGGANPIKLISKIANLISTVTGDYRVVRFLLVGASGLVVNSSTLIFFVEILDIHYLVSAVMATQFSSVWNFTLTEIWVFRGRKLERKKLRRLFQFILMNNLALLLRGPTISILVAWIGFHYVLANLLSLLGIAFLRYAFSDRWIWSPSVLDQSHDVFSYDIHGIVRIESQIWLPELQYFLVPSLDQMPDIRLRQERRREIRNGEHVIRYSDGFANQGFAISIAPGPCTEVQVSPLLRKSPHVLYTNVFEPLLRWTFVRRGYALVHAACIGFQDATMLITARTDTGKTSTILQAIKQSGFAFLSDDMTIIDSDGQTLCFPKPLTISAHSLKAVKGADLRPMERIKLEFQSRIHSRPGRQFALWLSKVGLPAATINTIAQIIIPPPKFMIDRLIPDVFLQERGSISHVIQIERGSDHQESMEHGAMVDNLLVNADDAYGFPPYPEIAEALSRWRGEDLHDAEREIISRALDTRIALRMRSRTYDWWQSLAHIMETYKPTVEAPAEIWEQDTQPVVPGERKIGS